MTKLTLETEYGTYSAESNKGDLNIYDLWDLVIRPAILAAGYSEDMVEKLVEGYG